jgi:Flp pilus assembly protein TadG
MRNAGSIVAGFLVVGGIIAAVTVMNQVSAQQKAEEEAAKARAAQATATAIAARQPTPRPGQPAQTQQQRPAGQQAQPAQQQQQRPVQQSGGQAQAARSSAPQQFRPAVRETPPKYPTVTLIVSTTFPDLTVTVGLNRDVRQGPRVSLNGSPPRDPVLAEDGTKIVQFENVPVGRHELVLYVPPYLPDIPPQTFRRTITISGNEPVARFSFG